AYLENEEFNIPDSIQFQLNCNDFNEEGEPRIFKLFKKEDEDISDFIRRIFKRKKKYRKEKDVDLNK
ncbi:MAG: hypothetical protein KAQ75_00410, partial [Bacteroidales bacterium]|nr:hypothetical protein [Bacteroidales bacterium]